MDVLPLVSVPPHRFSFSRIGALALTQFDTVIVTGGSEIVASFSTIPSEQDLVTILPDHDYLDQIMRKRPGVPSSGARRPSRPRRTPLDFGLSGQEGRGV